MEYYYPYVRLSVSLSVCPSDIVSDRNDSFANEDFHGT